MNLTNKKVLITGATGGIGNALIERYHNEGYNIFATGTNGSKLDKLTEIYADRLTCFKADLSQKDQIQGLVDEANEKLGEIREIPQKVLENKLKSLGLKVEDYFR